MIGALSRRQKLPYVWAGVLLWLNMPGVLFAAQLVGDVTPKLSGQSLIQALQQGGYIMYFRHGHTSNTVEKDVEDKDLDNCALQRNLSSEGQAQTRAIGVAFQQLQIPVSRVYASPYCRCMDTAKNIFGKVEKSPALHFAIHLDHTQRANVTVHLLDLLGTPPPQGTNIALISHTANLQEAVGIWPKPEGVAHIFKPESPKQFSYVGIMLPEAWTQEIGSGTSAAAARGEWGWFGSVRRWVRMMF